MEDRLVVKKISALTEKEQKAFAKFLGNKEYKNQYSILFNCIRMGLKKDDFSDERVFRVVFKKEKFNKTAFNKLVSELNKVFDDFLVKELFAQEGLKAQIEKQLVLLKFYSERNLQNAVAFTFRKAHKLISSLPYKESYYFESFYKLHSIENEIDQSVKEKKRNYALDRFYFFNKLRSKAIQDNDKKIFIQPSESSNQEFLINSILSYLEMLNDNEISPAISLLKDTITLLNDPKNTIRFNELEDNLFKNHETLNPKTAYDLFAILTGNYLEIEKDKNKIAEKVLQYSLFQIENDIIFVDGHFVSFVFENIVSIGLKAKSPEWVLKFIDDYGFRLHPDGRRGSIIFGRAKCYFYQGKFNESVDQLLKIKNYRFKNIYINIYVRILRIKAYYEIQYGKPHYDRNQPDRDIASFRKFISNHSDELTEQFVTRFKNFATVMSRMILCTTKAKANSIAEDVTNKYALTEDRIWLEEKIKELLESL